MPPHDGTKNDRLLLPIRDAPQGVFGLLEIGKGLEQRNHSHVPRHPELFLLEIIIPRPRERKEGDENEARTNKKKGIGVKRFHVFGLLFSIRGARLHLDATVPIIPADIIKRRQDNKMTRHACMSLTARTSDGDDAMEMTWAPSASSPRVAATSNVPRVS